MSCPVKVQRKCCRDDSTSRGAATCLHSDVYISLKGDSTDRSVSFCDSIKEFLTNKGCI